MIQSGIVNFVPIERVHFGTACAEAVATEAERRDARAVFMLISATLDRNTDVVAGVRKALGSRHAGDYSGVPPHNPRDHVIAAAEAARAVGTDMIVTLGGGSLTDAGKILQICLEHNIADMDGLEAYRIVVGTDGSRNVPQFRGPKIRQVTVPTTLSGGEFNPHAGCTDPRKKLKQGYRHPLMVPRAIILDPEITVHTPEWLWLSTGIRAVDHSVEALCSSGANPYCDGAAMHALRLLGEGLPRSKADPHDIEARLLCQIGVWHSMTAVQSGVPMGASHGIGHVLGGTCDVPHGYTSCVMLPSVLRYNKPVNADRQTLVSEAMGRPGIDAADVVADFIARLGLPRSLKDVGVGADQFELVARNAMHDPWIHANPRRLNGPEDVARILELAA